jgi:hypothetical protein
MTDSDNKNHWMPVVAGILTLIAGVTKLLAFLGVLIAAIFIPASSYSSWGDAPHMMWSANWMIAFMVPLLVLGVLAIIGGVYMLQRRMWGMALAGAIAALLPNTLLGIAAVVLIAISKDQFDHHDNPA